MNGLQRSAAAALLIFPVLGDAQTVRRPDWKLYGQERELTRGDVWADNKSIFFSYLNSRIARLEDGHLLVVTQDVSAGALKPIDAESKAAIRRRAELRIASGYEPPLAHHIASIEENKAFVAMNEKLANSELPGAPSQTTYEIDCECRMLRSRRLDLSQSWERAPPDTSRGALVTIACASVNRS
ncbi:MAG: hypothetical protein ABI821_06695 [Pseudomonadota bacterium]